MVAPVTCTYVCSDVCMYTCTYVHVVIKDWIQDLAGKYITRTSGVPRHHFSGCLINISQVLKYPYSILILGAICHLYVVYVYKI
jgi:hypothetical protein